VREHFSSGLWITEISCENNQQPIINLIYKSMKKNYDCSSLPDFSWQKLLLTMKISTLLFFCGITNLIAGTTYSQNTKISLNMKDASIESVLNKIEEESEFYFLFNQKLIDVERKVDIAAHKEPIKNVLHEIFGDEVKIVVYDRQIILTKSDKSATAAAMQQQTITGKVTDEKGEPIPGVSVIIKGKTNGTVTDVNGNYTLELPADAKILVFSYIGTISQEVVIASQTIINITLIEAAVGLNEVIVVGYGTVRKSDLTGSVSSVKSAQLVAFPTSGAVQALQGRAAGVQITANNGDPGGSLNVRVRGGTSINASSDPLYVVDGFIGGIIPQPEDIESLEVLKDASATAIYGSRASNGVILITTKKGSKGKAVIEYNSSYSSQSEINRIDMLNGAQYTEMTKEAFPLYVSAGQETDWQDEIFRKGGIQTHQLSISGGTDLVNYYMSGSFFDQKGIILGSSFNRYSVTSNINMNATERLKIGVNIFGQRSTTGGVNTQEISGGANEAGVVGSALRFMPDQGIYKADGITYATAAMGDPIDNPYVIINENTNNTVNDRLQGNFSAEYNLAKGLSFRTILGVSTTNIRNGRYASSLTVAGKDKGISSIGANKNTNVASENYLTYNTTFATVHKFGLMGGYSHSSYRNESWFAGSNTQITDAFSYWNLGGGSITAIPASGLVEGQQTSFFGRLNYGYSDKYLFTFTSRYDGSSNFSKNHKWAFFPSGALAWNMKNEGFLKDVSAISQLKWRVSYGVVGNQAIAPFQTLARLTNAYSIVNGLVVNAVRPFSVVNDDLKWESTAQIDVGADFGFFNNRLNLTADYYKMITSDLLFPVPLPNYSGYQTQTKNIGKIENKGFELTLSGKILTRELKWNIDFNIASNRKKVLELPGHKDILYKSSPGHLVSLGNSQILREGEPVGSFYGYIYDGVYQTGDTFLPGSGFEQVAGGEKYRDINGKKDANGVLTGEPDGLLNADDQTIVGNPLPKFFYGFNNELSWKDFDLSIFIQGTQGNEILSYTLLELETLGKPINSTTNALDRWTPTNTNTNVPKKTAARSERVSSRWIYDGSYMRLKNIVLGYNMPKQFLQKFKIQKVRLYVSAQNILTITKYPGFDPEVNYRGAGSTLNQGLDYASYPNAKSFTVGLNIGL